ncbi:MAG: hypothetical protein UU77_C0008G0016 [candidate division WWE3 bacterium GW2011_GWC1_41_7]|uniref:Glycosyltransferase RgtA/B/C/D-like domain-containing protein n=2 Tax=Katanobacteria TaxID=422282 RepID=A0A0G0XCM9_UNCKA|nr:MAG: hypothetical protein UU77_C0008G0016 [candidate division WWE3 bacterium GW2011_GWC1_41_7]KKS22620.1 MAG: hypothetical protein UU80_C0004G0010 [candidate division WWE3 bacterium GW2011_GWA1_41_8]
MRMLFKFTLLSVLVYFLSWLAVYKTNINKLSIQSEDTLPAMFLPVTILKEGTLYADTYYQMIAEKYPHPDDKSGMLGLTPFYFRKIQQPRVGSGDSPGVTENSSVNSVSGNRFLQTHYISAFPIITGLLAVPIYAIPILSGMEITWENLTLLVHLTASIIVGLSGGFLYLLLVRHFQLDDKKAWLLTVIYLFGTINYALISQALWQHGTVQLFTILGLYYLFNGLSDERQDHLTPLFFAGLFISLATLTRPTVGIVWVLLYTLIYFKYKTSIVSLFKSSVFFTLGLAPVLAFFLWYNKTFYLTLANQGYSDQVGDSWLSKFPEGFLGLWLSPSKGILIYSPIFLFSFIGIYLIFKRKHWRSDYRYWVFVLIVLLHTLVMGKWKHWYGGWSFGYRMASDIIPFMILLTVPYMQSYIFDKTKKIFIGLAVFSILVQVFGIIFFDGIWHSAYDRGFEDTGWLWSVRDSEFAFNIRRILVKLNILERACPQCLPRS